MPSVTSYTLLIPTVVRVQPGVLDLKTTSRRGGRMVQPCTWLNRCFSVRAKGCAWRRPACLMGNP
jgi:hypothetical protein